MSNYALLSFCLDPSRSSRSETTSCCADGGGNPPRLSAHEPLACLNHDFNNLQATSLKCGCDNDSSVVGLEISEKCLCKYVNPTCMGVTLRHHYVQVSFRNMHGYNAVIQQQPKQLYAMRVCSKKPIQSPRDLAHTWHQEDTTTQCVPRVLVFTDMNLPLLYQHCNFQNLTASRSSLI